MAGASGRVLVVDDNRVIRQLIRVNLELEGFEVVTAADGAECLEIVHSVRPDVVTLDAVMPRLDGARTALRLRADPRTQQVGIVMVSAGSLPEAVSGPGGVDAYLAKPFEPALLVETVRRLIRSGPRPPETAEEPAPPSGVPGEHRADQALDQPQPQGQPHPECQPQVQPHGQTAATHGRGPCG